MTLKIGIDIELARAVAARIAGVRPRKQHFLPEPARAGARARLVAFYLSWIGICQQTRTLEGVVGGVPHRGSDYLVHRLCATLEAQPERFDADHLATLQPDELRGWLADDGDPGHSTLDRVAERTALLNDIGRHLRMAYAGEAANLISESKGRLGGSRGLLARLGRMQAYRDPARKKSFLLVLFLRGLGILEPVDPEELGLPVDYHILRVFLRAGVLRIEGPRAAELLTGGGMTPEEDVRLREAAVAAGRHMVRELPLETLDVLLWMVGRNCCFYEHRPVCRTGPCQLGATCSFLRATDLDCGQRCPLDGTCRGSEDESLASIHEPRIDTDLY